MGREWVAESGRDLAFSFLFRADTPLEWTPSLAMATAVGVAEAMEAQGLTVKLKWPNDIFASGGKIAGILTECLTGESGLVMVVGIGVNVNMRRETAEKITPPATSYFLETGQEQDTDRFLDIILGRLPRWLEEWEDGGFGKIRPAWEKLAANPGEKIIARHHGRARSGTLAGYGEFGELLLLQADGEITRVWSGDIETEM